MRRAEEQRWWLRGEEQGEGRRGQGGDCNIQHQHLSIGQNASIPGDPQVRRYNQGLQLKVEPQQERNSAAQAENKAEQQP